MFLEESQCRAGGWTQWVVGPVVEVGETPSHAPVHPTRLQQQCALATCVVGAPAVAGPSQLLIYQAQYIPSDVLALARDENGMTLLLPVGSVLVLPLPLRRISSNHGCPQLNSQRQEIVHYT